MKVLEERRKGGTGCCAYLIALYMNGRRNVSSGMVSACTVLMVMCMKGRRRMDVQEGA